MNFYCQLDYAHIPYPSPTSPHGNLANNGCGVCCASMIVEELKKISFPPEVCAKFSKEVGAREGFGTDMSILAPALSHKFDIPVLSTYDTKEVIDFLEKKKGWVIANTIGDHEDWIGVFSDSRHYIVLCSLENHTVGVLDPLLSKDRYEKEGRKGKVQVCNSIAYADFSVIENDCMGKRYYMFFYDTK